MNINAIGNVSISTELFENILKKTKMKDADGEILFCDLKAKKDLHKKYMKMPYRNDRQYRAYSYLPEKKIFIFVNEGENLHSLYWLLAHELSHYNINQNEYLKICCHAALIDLLRSRNVTWQAFVDNYDKYIEDDSFHDLILEEQICNAFASSLIGADYGREWWKTQLAELDKKDM